MVSGLGFGDAFGFGGVDGVGLAFLGAGLVVALGFLIVLGSGLSLCSPCSPLAPACASLCSPC